MVMKLKWQHHEATQVDTVAACSEDGTIVFSEAGCGKEAVRAKLRRRMQRQIEIGKQAKETIEALEREEPDEETE